MAPLNLDQLSRIAAFKPARRRDDASPAETSLDSRSRRTYVNEPNPAVEFLCQKLGAFPQRNARGEHLVIQKFFFEPSCCDTTFPALPSSRPTRRKTPPIPPPGSSSTPKLPALPVAPALTHFSSASLGGIPAACKSSKFSCVTTPMS